MRVLINLDHTGAAGFRGGCLQQTGFCRVGIENGDDVAQALAIGFHQALELLFEFDFFLEPGIVLQGFQLLELFLKGLFGCTKFSESGQYLYSNSVFG
ncbi:hypothetical protein D3C78_1477690 [compost metagenome]